jgi:hypothetical protein
MFNRITFRVCLPVAMLFATVPFLGCDAKKDIPVAVVESKGPALSQATLTRLEEADLLDGKADHVVGKCYVCSLGMDGSEKHAAKIGDYTAHLCSKFCLQEFEKSSEQVILSTEIPKGSKQE